ncbi:penicillin acylase family protein [Falsibacillus albus]|uniref:Penicillin acylase family protein n=1 Tax=Falsibacillus albus TaxID=2478915 RepID=A0A3L7JSZ4_9BACI|nr:penicillin acylase family protein [Falsibacillus albus]RLQ91632.1 penicillin acylase family protein [Falsibacillus albus]
MEVVLQPKRRKRWVKILIWSAAILVLLVIAAAIFANVFTERLLPKTAGELSVAGLSKKVEVIRDNEGVPHIQAENEHDLYFAQGYVQAQDRLFQMDLSRRQASGRLSEVIGASTIDRDKFFRTLGLRRAAEASYNNYSEKAKEVLQAFADGVNAYIKDAEKEKKLPIEFTLLDYKPDSWTPTDSLTIGKYMAFDLGGHWQGQAFRYWAEKNLSSEKAKELFPSYPEDAPAIIADLGDMNIDVEKTLSSSIIPPEFNGSNNWVVSGEKSESGKPMLADDPHLSLATPSIWYQMALKTNGMDVSGVIFAGIPGIILGHNEHIAWGVTNTGPDVQDLYIEKRNPDNKDEFLYKDKWEKATIIQEPIKVKGEKTIPYEVTITRHGPVISDFAYKQKGDSVFSLRWTALDPSSELEAVLNMNKANNWKEFEKALEKFETPTQNFVFASDDGTIAYKANGKIPIRKSGDGLLPVPGWTDEYEWTGFIPFDELPKVVNPKEGFISSANNKVISSDYPYHISNTWAQPYRQMRIQEVLKSKDKLSVEDMQSLQMDQTNLYAREFVPQFLKVMKNDKGNGIEKEALKLLGKWNYVDDKNKPAPLIFNLWMKEIPKVLYEKDIPDDVLNLFDGKQQVTDNILRTALAGENCAWVDENGGIDSLLHTALKNVLNRLAKDYGNHPEQWKWGDYHQLYFAHPISQASNLLAYFFNNEDPIPVGGSQVTVQAASYEDDGIVDHGASWRFVIDTDDMSKSYHIIGPGESGHFRSQWYHNQIKDWIKGNYHLTNLNEKPGENKYDLTLLPKKNSK